MKRIFGIMILVMFVMVGAVLAEEAAKPASPESDKPAAKRPQKRALQLRAWRLRAVWKTGSLLALHLLFLQHRKGLVFVEFQNVDKGNYY